MFVDAYVYVCYEIDRGLAIFLYSCAWESGKGVFKAVCVLMYLFTLVAGSLAVSLWEAAII